MTGEEGRGEATEEVEHLVPPKDGPHAEQCVRITVAFNDGDIGEARRLARAVTAASDATADERAFTGEILARTAIDPVAVATLVGCFGLFWFVIYWFVWR
jgi:hypothetical protein